MSNSKNLKCPYCQSNRFTVKYEASYVYSYIIDSDAPGLKNTNEFLSYMYDNREQNKSIHYLECMSCKTRFPCYFNEWKNVNIEDLQHIIDRQNSANQ